MTPRFINGTPAGAAGGKAVCVGRNYLAHIHELKNAVPKEPVLFIKPATAITPLKEPIVLPQDLGACRHETELALLIGKTLTKVSPDEARAAVTGYGLALDLTLTDVQADLKKKGLPWERAKAFDGSCPLSPFLPAGEVDDPEAIRFSLTVNGERRQEGDVTQMMTGMFDLVAHISLFFTLLPGDVVLTGTPEGVESLESGDRLELELHPGSAQTHRFTTRTL